MKNIMAYPSYAPEAENPGMTLLDYFAGHILSGMLGFVVNKDNAEMYAREVYQLAAAMLTERENILKKNKE